jgi:hypothetical protein
LPSTAWCADGFARGLSLSQAASAQVEQWRKNHGIALADVVQSNDIYVRTSSSAVPMRPSRQMLEDVFGTSCVSARSAASLTRARRWTFARVEVDVVELILQKGDVKSVRRPSVRTPPPR